MRSSKLAVSCSLYPLISGNSAAFDLSKYRSALTQPDNVVQITTYCLFKRFGMRVQSIWFICIMSRLILVVSFWAARLGAECPQSHLQDHLRWLSPSSWSQLCPLGHQRGLLLHLASLLQELLCWRWGRHQEQQLLWLWLPTLDRPITQGTSPWMAMYPPHKEYDCLAWTEKSMSCIYRSA